jgi:periplasmic protein TonB
VVADILGEACPIGFGQGAQTFTFPRIAMYQGISGAVVVRAEILPSGRSGRMWIKISSGHSLLDNEAMNQISRHVFTVTPEQKAAGAFWVDIPINYQLDEK